MEYIFIHLLLLFKIICASTTSVGLPTSGTEYSNIVAGDSENDFRALFQRVRQNEKHISQLLGMIEELSTTNGDFKKRIQTLETREEQHQLHIQKLESQLETQQLRTTVLERIVQNQWQKTDDGSSKTVEPTETHDDEKSLMTTNRIRRAEGELIVAFTAAISGHHIEHAGDHQVIVFDNVITNIGNAYNGHLGTFVAPVGGVYVFSVTLFAPSSVSFHGTIVKNGQTLTWMYLSGSEIGGFDTASQTVALQLQKGDDITIQHRDIDRKIYGYNFTTFTGFLLREDFSQIVVGK